MGRRSQAGGLTGLSTAARWVTVPVGQMEALASQSCTGLPIPNQAAEQSNPSVCQPPAARPPDLQQRGVAALERVVGGQRPRNAHHCSH